MESLQKFIKRNEHQALSILREAALAMGFTAYDWSWALQEYYRAP